MAQTLTIKQFRGEHGLHSVKLGKDDVLYCTCPNWKFQRRRPDDRQCKHTRQVVAEMAQARMQQYKEAA